MRKFWKKTEGFTLVELIVVIAILGILAGALFTAVIQSSSATTVMVVGFVNSGMMTLRQAVWIIMGANIGTTITGQLIALDVGMIAPLFAFIGVAMIVFIKVPKVNHIGKISNATLVLILFTFCFLVFKVFAQISKSSSSFHFL